MNASLLVLSLATAAAAPNDVLYDFYSTHCGPCQMMMPIVERLHAEGYPVVKINIDERPDLMQRFGIQVVPTFVLIIGGKESSRISGLQEESILRGMLAQIPRRAPRTEQPTRIGRSVPVRLADDETKSKLDFHLHLPPLTSSRPKNDMVQIDDPSSGPSVSSAPPSNSGTLLADSGDVGASKGHNSNAGPDPFAGGGDESVARGAAPRGAAEPDVVPDPSVAPMLNSSARIRVTDEGGIYFGSGVVIDGTAGNCIVLTCGHILRDVKPESRIEVDLFEGRNFRSFRGTIVKFNLDADVGLLKLQTTSNVPASAVAGAEEKVVRGQPLLSIGCSRGERPMIERLRVTMLNRYEGPDTIECTGVPVKGRSGGGLFTTSGHVVGVCTNADPQEGRGVYAGLKPIHQLLRNAGLEELIPGASRRPRGRMVDLAAAPAAPATPLPGTADEPSPSPTKLELELAQLKQSRGKGPASDAAAEETVARPDADQATVAAAAGGTEDAEVICIIRPLHRAGTSKVVIINRASRKFMNYLTGETKGQPQPAVGQAETSPDAASPPLDPSHIEPSVSTASTQTTSAWKPTPLAVRFPSN
jgi:thiol-disulfide isomerase/thioredoxin/S1-C subfamily serine protease